MKFSPLDTAALMVVLLSTSCLPANAEDICSREGKAKMRAASVTEPQIAGICPATTASALYIQMEDLRLDIASLVGQKVRVRGVGRSTGNNLWLGKA